MPCLQPDLISVFSVLLPYNLSFGLSGHAYSVGLGSYQYVGHTLGLRTLHLGGLFYESTPLRSVTQALDSMGLCSDYHAFMEEDILSTEIMLQFLPQFRGKGVQQFLFVLGIITLDVEAFIL